MTGRADFGLGALHQLTLERLRTVHAVAGGAGEVSRFVGTAFPAGVIPAVVTREARTARFFRGHLRELLDVALVLVVHVRLSRPVAALASLRGRRRARVLCLRVLGSLQRFLFVSV